MEKLYSSALEARMPMSEMTQADKAARLRRIEAAIVRVIAVAESQIKPDELFAGVYGATEMEGEPAVEEGEVIVALSRIDFGVTNNGGLYLRADASQD